VTAGLKRYYGYGDLHFITCSCFHRRALLTAPQRRDLFLAELEQMRRSYRVVVLGYVVMPEHFHLLLSEPHEGSLSTFMQALKLGFARRVISELRRGGEVVPGRVWQSRFYDFNVWSGRKRIEKMRYMHENPVRRGLIDEPNEWRWSSFRSYAYGEAGPVRLNDASVLGMKVSGRALEKLRR
jgi:putative transposase